MISKTLIFISRLLADAAAKNKLQIGIHGNILAFYLNDKHCWRYQRRRVLQNDTTGSVENTRSKR